MSAAPRRRAAEQLTQQQQALLRFFDTCDEPRAATLIGIAGALARDRLAEQAERRAPDPPQASELVGPSPAWIGEIE